MPDCKRSLSREICLNFREVSQAGSRLKGLRLEPTVVILLHPVAVLMHLGIGRRRERAYPALRFQPRGIRPRHKASPVQSMVVDPRTRRVRNSEGTACRAPTLILCVVSARCRSLGLYGRDVSLRLIPLAEIAAPLLVTLFSTPRATSRSPLRTFSFLRFHSGQIFAAKFLPYFFSSLGKP